MNIKLNISRYVEGSYKILVGLVCEVTSPKGIKAKEREGYSYKLHEKLLKVCGEESIFIPSGLYHVCIIYKSLNGTGVYWDQILLEVRENTIKTLKRFSGQKDSSWVKRAIPVLKEAYNNLK